MKNLLIASLLLLGVFGFVGKAEAVSEYIWSINPNQPFGVLSARADRNYAPNSGDGIGNNFGARGYKGEYPDTSNQVSQLPNLSSFNYNGDLCAAGYVSYTQAASTTCTGFLIWDTINNPFRIDINGPGYYWLGVYDPYPNITSYSQFYFASTTVGNATTGTSTRIIDLLPHGTTTSTTVNLSAQIFYNDTGDVEGESWAPYVTSVEIQLVNVERGYQHVPIYLPILQSGGSTLATTTALLTGKYTAVVSFYGTSTIAQDTPFRARSRLFEFTVVKSLIGEYGNDWFLEEQAEGKTCETITDFFLNASFCLYGFFVPSGEQLNATWQNFRSTFLLKAPWGYVVRANDIFTDDSIASTTPPSIVNLPLPDIGLGTTTISVDPFSQMGGVGTYPEEAVNYILPYWNRFFDVLFIGWLFMHFFGARMGQHEEVSVKHA